MSTVVAQPTAPYQKTILPSGIRVISEHIPSVHSVTLGVWIWSGSRFESESQHGVAHFLEHMLFKGTARRNAFEIARTIESQGGYLNAFTGKELNCYFVRVLKDADEVSIDLLADILQNSVFDPIETEKEKGVVIDEINGMEDTPEELVLDTFTGIVWQPHTLSRSILGTPDAVASLNPDGLREYLDTHYVSDRVYVIATGAVDHDRLVRLVDKAFSLPKSTQGVTFARVERPERQIAVVSKDISQAHLCLGGVGIPYNDPRKYALYVLNTVLGGGMTSRLFQSIREQAGLAYAIYSDLDFYHDTGLLSIYAGTDADDVPLVLEEVYKECDRLCSEPIGDLELKDAKSQLTGGLLLSLESPSNVMNRLARGEIYLDQYETTEDSIASVNAVSLQDVQELAADLLAPDRLSLAVVGPMDESDILSLVPS